MKEEMRVDEPGGEFGAPRLVENRLFRYTLKERIFHPYR